MIVDIHTHTFPDQIAAETISALQAASRTKSFATGTNSGLQASMADSGVDCSILLPVATNPEKVPRINDKAVHNNKTWNKSGLYSFGCIHPHMDDTRRELERIAALGLKGIKIHPAYQHTYFDDPKYFQILEVCGELGLIVLAHAGIDIDLTSPVFYTPKMVRRSLNIAGPVKLILAHMGGWRQWEEVEDELADTSVYLDTSFSFGTLTPLDNVHLPESERNLMGEAQFLRFIRSFGTHRILFGSDSPWGDPSADISRIRALPLSSSEQNAILGENACKLLSLERSSDHTSLVSQHTPTL